MRAAATLALAAIRFYQRCISPYKGFSCALRMATGGASCSAYGHAVIARFGLRRGLGLLQRRFELCGHAHAHLRPTPPPPHPRLKYQRGFCDAPCDLPCHPSAERVSADAVDALCCAYDAGDACRSTRMRDWLGARRRNRDRLDAAVRQIARREATQREERTR